MKLRFVLGVVLSVLTVEGALAQSSPKRTANSGEQVSDEVRLMCRDAVRKVCSPTFPPDFAAIRRCAEDNKDKLPAQCGPLIATAGPPPR